MSVTQANLIETVPAIDIEMPKEDIVDIASMGEGLKLMHRDTIELKPDKAAEFLDYPEFIVDDVKVDRNRSESHVVYLVRAMLSGTFLWEQVNLVLCTVEGQSKPTRLNGNHTCWARLIADDQGLDPKTRCPVQLLKYKAKTMEDMRRLYASLDRGKPRSAGVVLNSYLAGTDEFSEVPKSLLPRLAQGLGVWMWENPASRVLHKSDDRAYYMLNDHKKLALEVAKILQASQNTKWMRRAPVIGAMFASCNKAPQIAYEFWKEVREGLGFRDKDDPRYVLRNWLMQTTLAKSEHNGDLKTLSQEECYRGCIYRWNDHRKGRRVKHMRLDMSLERPEAQ